ncbi:hypothetical protein Taro_004914 [Colocasia esculenta]|uniref:Pentatricopeptide repeat-containing protein n=1 Tax=Colocasia esculenta TaxID=4460 RepID=A0A843TT30_COLES|nr:hypothetical protein [Colocasia esculenta]
MVPFCPQHRVLLLCSSFSRGFSPPHAILSSAPSMDALPQSNSAMGWSRFSTAAAFETYLGTCASLLLECAARRSLAGGRAIHAHAIKAGVSSFRPVSAKLLEMYSSCGRLVDCVSALEDARGFDLFSWNVAIASCARWGNLDTARRLFDEMPKKNDVSWTVMVDAFMKCGRVRESVEFFRRNPCLTVVSWTAAICGFVQNGLEYEALVFFREMLETGVIPNEVTYTSVVKACVGSNSFDVGLSVFGLIVRRGYDKHLSVTNSLITLHIRMQDLDSARTVFEQMEKKDVISWTAVLDVYIEVGELSKARHFFDEMPEKNEVSWSAMIARYTQGGCAMEALRLFDRMVSDGFKPNTSCISSVLCASASLNNVLLGSNVHGLVIKTGVDGNIFVSSALIDMYCKCGKPDEGRQVFDTTSEKNAVCWNAMVAGYSSNSRSDEAEELFKRMPGKGIISWNGLISGLVDNEDYEKVMETFGRMLVSGQMPDQTTFSSVLCACACFSSLEKGKNLHGKIMKLGFMDSVFIGTALTDMYAKSGDVESSKKIFSQMPEKNDVAWAAMIQGLADNGLAEESVVLFEGMRRSTEIIPSESLFLSILSACVHCGLVDKGIQYFDLMKNGYGIIPTQKHYTCMVDLLARAGRLREAEKFINKIPLRPESNAWAALLSACRTQGNDKIGERAAKRLWALGKQNPSNYILLSNIYASVGRWKDVEKVRTLMRQTGLKKTRGCSSVLIQDKFYTFLSWDASDNHEKSLEMYWMLELLMSELTA